MARLRTNNILGTAVGNPCTLSSAGTTTISWLSAPGFATISGSDYYVIIVEPDTANEEIVHLTAFTSGNTTGTVSRAQEGSSGATHTAVAWVHGPTAGDYGLSGLEYDFTAAGQIPVGTGAGTGSLLANGTAGQVLTAVASAAPAWATPTDNLIASNVVAGSSTTSVSFSTISGSYNHLRMVGFYLVSATTITIFGISINSDATAADYAFAPFATSGGPGTGTLGFTVTDVRSGSGVNTEYAELFLPGYATTTLNHSALFLFSGFGGANGSSGAYGIWKSTSAITTLTMALNTGHFVAGSSFYLYGIN